MAGFAALAAKKGLTLDEAIKGTIWDWAKNKGYSPEEFNKILQVQGVEPVLKEFAKDMTAPQMESRSGVFEGRGPGESGAVGQPAEKSVSVENIGPQEIEKGPAKEELDFSENWRDPSQSGTDASIREGAGAYEDVGGHHVYAKSAFRGHPAYDPQKGFSISQEFMKNRDWDHQKMTLAQRQLFDELAASGRPNTLTEHTKIAVEALKAGGATEAEAREIVDEALKDLRDQGISPTKIPWNSTNNGD
jgi:hypothetical protein